MNPKKFRLRRKIHTFLHWFGKFRCQNILAKYISQNFSACVGPNILVSNILAKIFPEISPRTLNFSPAAQNTLVFALILEISMSKYIS
ncbi:MAG: hypothetical protein GY679_04205 [Mycoplasma sp.]|nr:hypothetical protein [Mycoplasma sp.]